MHRRNVAHTTVSLIVFNVKFHRVIMKPTASHTHHRVVAMTIPTPIQSTNTTQSRNLTKSTTCSFNTNANPTDDAAKQSNNA